jgi:fermentation-respiration switch protein FrsA (DUF1100 family)
MKSIKHKISLSLLMLAGIFIFKTSSVASSLEGLQPGKNAVSFKSEGLNIVAPLFLPASYIESGKHATIVVVTPASGVKEQTAGIYAQKLAEQGFVTLAFDHRTFGESEGQPRCMENAPMKVEDIKNAISFVGTVPGVDKNNIGVMGICSGAGYSIQTACFDARVKSLAIVSGFIDFTAYGLSGGTQYMYQLSGDDISQFQQQMKMASNARQKYFETGETVFVDGIPAKGSQMGEFWERAADYYHNPERGGAVKSYNPKRAAMSLDTRYFFNATDNIELMRGTPFLAIAGSKAYTAYYSEQAVNKAKCKDKEYFKINGAHHFDLYDGEKYVKQVVGKLTEFYQGTLK